MPTPVEPAAAAPTVSLCMIVKDEAAHLSRCLASVKGVVDEIIVVDTGSTDDTVAIAENGGARVLRHAWRQDFSEARNVSLAHATGDWVLVLDADEALDASAAQALKPLLGATDADGLLMIQRNLMPAGELCRYQDLRITRLFRNHPAHRFRQAIHEQVRPAIQARGGKMAVTDLVILHYGYAERTVQGGHDRAHRNRALLEQAIAQAPDDPYLMYQLGITCKAVGETESAMKHLQRVLELDHAGLGRDVQATLFMKLAQLSLEANRYPAAIAYGGQALTLAPDNIVARYVTALAYMFLGQVEPAYRHFLRVRASPNCNPSGVADLEAVIAYCRTVLAPSSVSGAA